MPTRFDTIVIGLGAMGSAALYQLAKAGQRVLGIDQVAPPHRLGSSHGETRITRLACGEGPEYTQFARRSHEIWRELEGKTGKSLLVQNGFLAISGEGPRAANHENPDFLVTTIEAAERAGIAHELLTDAAIRRRYPAFNILDRDRGYFEPEAGFVRPEECIAAQLQQATALGAEVRANETVTGFTTGGSAEVTTDRGRYIADKIIISAGAWLPGLLRRERSDVFTVRRQVLYWFRLKPDAPLENYRPDRFPVYIWQLPARQAIYGFPWTGEGAPAIKIATEQYDTATSPQAIDRTVSERETRAMFDDYVAPYFPGASGDCDRSAVCMYTCVDKARFIIDELPGEPRVIVASPCSGHGFKHSAAIGEALADLAINGKTAAKKFDLSRFGMPA
ncbi:MAG: N-methyl-L-tryptophan oxidase [Alphaproteobacteria bacterium]